MNNRLSLYLHYPYCIRKCPYCDFNSYAVKDAAYDFEQAYLEGLKREFELFIPYLDGRKFISVFIGGGTPSIASVRFIQDLLDFFKPYCDDNAEISMEANPGTVDLDKLFGIREAGINRLSLGIQSFNDKSLKRLGRIHDGNAARLAVEHAFKAGFTDINLDIMHGLMEQNTEDALQDLKTALAYPITHLSWYELTIEEDTYFGKKRPKLPDDNVLYDIEHQGFAFLQDNGFDRYEVSAFCRDSKRCVHNENYWLFGDYVGLGAGAHSKLSFLGQVLRKANDAEPEAYLSSVQNSFYKVADEEIAFEYMLNRLRLFDAVTFEHYEKATGQSFETVRSKLLKAEKMGLIAFDQDSYVLTNQGRLMLNEILELFL